MPKTRFFFLGFLLWASSCGLKMPSSSGFVSRNGNNPSSESPPSRLTYASASLVATRGLAIDESTPSDKGQVQSFSISPVLPAGLILDAKTGILSAHLPRSLRPLRW